jgi:3-oxoacyl-[acyl-carrier protein] reductase
MTGQRTVLVVGGAGGIGLASARAIAVDGSHVVLADRDPVALKSAVEDLRLQGHAVDGYEMDVTDAAAVDRTIGRVAAERGLHGLVNAAGVLQLGTILDVEEADWSRVLAVNLGGVYRTCRAAVAEMQAANGGSIVNLASQSGRTKSFFSAPNYVASKAGVIGLTMAIAAQHAAEGIRANAIAPGLIETAMTADAYTNEQRMAMTTAIPMGRSATAEEVAAVVAFLISDRSSYITGQTINVNGGSFML